MREDLPEALEARLEELLELPSDRARAELDALITRWPAHAVALRKVRSVAWPEPATVAPEERRDTLHRLLEHAERLHREPASGTIGPYTLVRSLGSGAMGEVYLAERGAPVPMRVAIKVVKRGIDTAEVLARFAHERQALARMSHESIARVHDAGATEHGQPYFVMELIEGLPITDYCDRHRLDLGQRIELFCRVCAGVQHAHQKGVIHRDLKPSNVLVADREGAPAPKIIDFGLARATQRGADGRSLLSEAGQLIGTPEYMSPEQARGAIDEIDTRTDVYSLGVMLYELLTGDLPFPSRELRHPDLEEVRRRIAEEEPTKPSTRVSTHDVESREARARVRALSAFALPRALRGDLDWIVMRALRKEPERRYESANAIAADLHRFLRHEPVEAGPPSTAYRLRKLARRYRGQVAAGSLLLVAVAGGGIVSSVGFAVAAARQAEFDQLAGVVLHDRAVARAAELYPAWPRRIDDLEAWLREDCGSLLRMRPRIEETLAELRARALPWTEAQRRRDLEQHPKFSEWQTVRRWLASLRYAQAIRDGETELVVPALSGSRADLTTAKLIRLASDRLAPNPSRRRVWGEEALGLVFAQAAVAEDPENPRLLVALAWALLANGKDSAALATMDEAVAAAPEALKEDFATNRNDLLRRIEDAELLVQEAETRLAELGEEVRIRRTWEFPADNEAERFLHDTLVRLLQRLDGLERERTSVERRLSWARRIGALTRAHPAARVGWDAVRASLRDNERYAGASIELRDEDVIGLVPLGANPATGYQEFYHLRSAWDGESDPAELPIPVHRADGSVEVTGDTGIVFVLLPGGVLDMGAQPREPERPNFDPRAFSNESPVHRVPLAPFFLARHELTQGQWQRLWNGDEAFRRPSEHGTGKFVGRARVTPAHPVERIDWIRCEGLLADYGLALPTEAQWEYGCRGGSPAPWSCPEERLFEHANLADRAAKAANSSWSCESWDDGHAVHAPVGSLLPNAFGLFDVHGNVAEWTRDSRGSYADPVRPGDGLRIRGDGSGSRVIRGGAWDSRAVNARSAVRHREPPESRSPYIGLRVVRATRP